MFRILGGSAMLALLVLVSPALAERVNMTRTSSQYTPGVRPDITVPYTTNGGSTFGVYNGVAPEIMSKPGVGKGLDTQVTPVHNLIYYGAKLGTNSSFGAASPRQANKLRPGK